LRVVLNHNNDKFCTDVDNFNECMQGVVGENSDWIGKNATLVETRPWYQLFDCFGEEEVIDYSKYNMDCEDDMVNQNNKIGFLLVLLENISSDNLFDVKLTLREYDTTNQINNEIQKLAEVFVTKEKYIILLSIYNANNKGFEDSYLSVKNELISIEFVDSEGKQYSKKIRPPYKESAIRKYLGYGWHGQ